MNPTTSTPTLSPTRTGLAVGARIGFLVSLVYLLLFDLLLILTTASSYSGVGDLVRAVLFLLPFSLLVGGIVGVLPATVVGALTGWLLATILARRGGSVSLDGWRRMALGICFVIALVVNLAALLLIWAQGVTDFVSSYLLFLGVPSLAYLASGVWIATRVYRRLAPPNVEPALSP